MRFIINKLLKELAKIPQVWSNAWASSRFRNHLALTVMAFIASSLYNFHYLKVWESRPGVVVNDIILNYLPPLDFSLPIFLLEYTSLLLVFTFLLTVPERLVKGLQAYALVLFFRTVAIYLVVLEPPKDMILLYDPVANLFLHSNDVFVTKDLFFSGHVSGLALFFFVAPNRYVKMYVGMAMVLVSIFIVWQHVHYTLDVVFAPIATYAAYRLVYWLDPATRTKYGTEFQDA